MTELLSKDDILNINDVKKEQVEIPEWGGYVYVRVMSGFARDQFESQFIGSNGKGFTNVRAKLASLTVCDEGGRRLFTEADISALGEKSGAALDRIFEVAQRINHFSDKDVDELEKK